MPRLRWMPILLLAAPLCAAPAGASEPGSESPAASSDNRADLRLVVDYLPAFLYADEASGNLEPLSYSFRVVKREGAPPAEYRLVWRFLDAAGKELMPGSARGEVAERFSLAKGFLEVPRRARSFEYALESGGRQCGAGRAVIVREEDAWPASARAELNGLAGPAGERLILALPERTAKVDNSWKPFKRLLGGSRRKSESAIVVGPRMAPPGARSYLEMLAGCAPKLTTIDLSAPPPAAARTPPAAGATRGIFALIEAVENQAAAAAKGVDLVVLVMPQSDPELGTDPRVYRQGLDWVTSRLLRAGAARVAVLPPMSRRVPEKQLAAYAAACARSAEVYRLRGAEALDGSGPMAERCWALPGASGEVTGRFPNDAGQEVLARLIKEACR